MTRRLRRICLNTREEPASPFHLLKCCGVEQIQFAVTQVLDGLTRVFRQDVPQRCGFGCRVCGRGSWCQRRGIGGRIGREEVRRRLRSTFLCHSRIIAPGMYGGNDWTIDRANGR
jgi:hypothetical protein